MSPVRDMTSGNPLSLILAFAVPMLMGTLFQQFYSMVDTIIVGKFLGVDALASVGSTGAVNFMVNGFVIGVTAGFAIPVAQQFGAQNYRNMRKYVANTIWLTIGFSVVMTAVIGALTWKILVWMRTPENIIQGAYNYIFIIFLGIPVTYLYNLTASIIRALGDSKTPVYFLILSSLVNIVLDYISINFLGMGVAGPACATVISQGLSGILCVLYMKKKFTILHFQKGEMEFGGRMCLNLCNMGIPMGLQYSITAIGSVILQTAVNGLGSTAVASVTAAGKISMFCCCPFDALGSTMATYAGQNVGAKKMDRVNTGILASSIIGSVYSVVILGVMFLWSRQISLLFVDASETVILDQARQMLLINMVFYIPLTLVNVVRFTVQGMGFSKFAILAGVCEMIGRSVVAFFLVPYFGYTAVCFASPVAWVLADLFLVPAYLYCAKTLRSLFEKNAQMM